MFGGVVGFIYVWSLSIGISDVMFLQLIFFLVISIIYIVMVMVEGIDQCEVIEIVEVIVLLIIGLEVSGGGNFCMFIIMFIVIIDVVIIIEWYLGSDFVFIGFVFMLVFFGIIIYIVVVIDDSGCLEFIIVMVSGGLVDISVFDIVVVCLGEEIMLSVINFDFNDMFIYFWEFVELFVVGINISVIFDYFEVIGVEDVMVIVIN